VNKCEICSIEINEDAQIHFEVGLNEFTKLGFTKLLKPYENSLDDIVKTTRAFGMATKIHSGQFKQQNKTEPYINHPLRVALILTDELHKYDVDIVCAALLHETLEKGSEDNSMLEERLKTEFGETVYKIVSAVTNPKTSDKREKLLLDEYFENITKSSLPMRYVKLADHLDTVRSLKKSVQKDKVLRYKEEIQKYIVPIAQKTDERLLFKLSVALYELK
jgi:(p)ppGpp synthase/HD superfamily hydrolase